MQTLNAVTGRGVILSTKVRDALARFYVRILVTIEEMAKKRQLTLGIPVPQLHAIWTMSVEQGLRAAEIRKSPDLEASMKRFAFSLRLRPELLKGTVAPPVSRSRLRRPDPDDRFNHHNDTDMDHWTPLVFPAQIQDRPCATALQYILDRSDEDNVSQHVQTLYGKTNQMNNSVTNCAFASLCIPTVDKNC